MILQLLSTESDNFNFLPLWILWEHIFSFFYNPDHQETYYECWNEKETLLSLNECSSIFPELFLGLSLIILLLFGTYNSTNYKKNYPLIHIPFIRLTILSLIFYAILLINNNKHLSNNKFSFFNNTIVIDNLGLYSKFFLVFIAIIYLLSLIQYVNYEKINSFEYTLLLLFSIFGILLICFSNDLITVYLAIELQSLSFYLLASYKKSSVFSTEAGLKYFILGAFSSSFFLFGSSLIYGVTGSLNFEDFKDLYFYINPELNLIHKYNNLFGLNLLDFGLIFILISLFFKLALVPFHIWSPDVYEGSLTGSTFFFAVMPKLGIFILLIRFFSYGFYNFLVNWQQYLIIISLISIILGSFAGLEQRKLKTLLAYSSINHMGYSLIAFSTFTFEGIQVLLNYLIVYVLSSLCLWTILISLKLKTLKNTQKNNKDLTDIVKLVKSNKVLAIFFAVVILSIAGFPPLIGFYAKLNVFLVAIETTLYFTAIVAILCSVVSAFYYLRLVKVMFFEKEMVGKLYLPISYQNALIISLGFFLIIYLFINPNILYLLSYTMVL